LQSVLLKETFTNFNKEISFLFTLKNPHNTQLTFFPIHAEQYGATVGFGDLLLILQTIQMLMQVVIVFLY
jgi:hypothetical protein